MSTIVESEMREFFQRVIDSVAELSTQANRVEGLTQQVNDLGERLNQLEQTNRELNAHANETASKLNETMNMLATAQSMLESERAVTNALRETIIQRDAGVVQLEQSFRQEQDAHKLTTSERDDARQKIQELEFDVERFRTMWNEATVDRDYWRGKASELESTNAKLQQQLGQIQSVLNPLRIVSGDVATG